MDKNQESLNELFYKIKEKNLENIIIFNLADKIKLRLLKESIDMVLLFDVLHLVDSRVSLFTELKRILKPTGILSVYPKHHQTHMNMSLEEVIKEIQSVGFCFNVKIFKKLMHDNKLENGYILNFKKV